MKFRTRVTIVFFVSYMMVTAAVTAFFYCNTVAVQKEELRKELMRLSDLGTKIVPASLVDSIVPVRSSMQAYEYKELAAKLKSIKNIGTDIDDVYVLVNTPKPGVMKFIANCKSNEVVDCGEEYDVTPFPELIAAVKGPSADREIIADRWGTWLSGYAPVKREDGSTAGILGMDVSAKTISEMRNTVRNNVIYIFLVGIVIALFAGEMVSWWLAKPLAILMKGMAQVSAGDLGHKIELKSSDEFGKVGENFNKMATDLDKYIKELTKTTKEKERLNRELEIAGEIQRSMLPHHTMDVKELDFAGMSLPAKQVGGDYFDYNTADGRNIGFVIADAAGKGLPSSIFMTNSKSIFKVVATEEKSPAKVIERTNDFIIREMDPGLAMFVTMFYGIYDKDRKVFKYSNAGHNPPLAISGKDASVRLLTAHGFPLGINEGQKYGEDEIKMEKGDFIVLYTDGVVEAISAENEAFGIQHLIDIVQANKSLGAGDIIGKIKDEVAFFSKPLDQFDDLTLLIFKIK